MSKQLNSAERYLKWLRSRTCPVRSHPERYRLELASAKARVARTEKAIVESVRLQTRAALTEMGIR